MINNTFFIVCREKDMNSPNHNLPGRDRWGWEFVDLVERMDWKTAEKELREYQAAMPHHHVRIRACRIGENYGRPAN
ncbi:MAG TPA: hypothetical protein DDY18_09010 [Flavobacterium sp.]|nr:hypothetical protein [Flavobacterium sp.]